MRDGDATAETSAQAYIAQLAERGIEYVFANAGTDFAPIVEALASNEGKRKYPRFIVVPHENVAISMAQGYYRVAGKPAAVPSDMNIGVRSNNGSTGTIAGAASLMTSFICVPREPCDRPRTLSPTPEPVEGGTSARPLQRVGAPSA